MVQSDGHKTACQALESPGCTVCQCCGVKIAFLDIVKHETSCIHQQRVALTRCAVCNVRTPIHHHMIQHMQSPRHQVSASQLLCPLSSYIVEPANRLGFVTDEHDATCLLATVLTFPLPVQRKLSSKKKLDHGRLGGRSPPAALSASPTPVMARLASPSATPCTSASPARQCAAAAGLSGTRAAAAPGTRSLAVASAGGAQWSEAFSVGTFRTALEICALAVSDVSDLLRCPITQV